MLVTLLWRTARPYRRRVTAVVLLMSTQSAAGLALPTLNADIINNGIARGSSGHVLGVGAVMLGVAAVQIGCGAAAVYLGVQVALHIGADLRAQVFRRVHQLPGREVRRFGTSSLHARTTNDVQQLEALVLQALTSLAAAPVMGLGGVTLALGQDVPLSLLLVVVLPLLVGSFAAIIRSMGPAARAMQGRIEQIHRVVREQIEGTRVIRAFANDDRERRRFAVANDDLTAAALTYGRRQALMKPAVMLVVDVATIFLLWFGALRVDAGSIQVGTLVAFMHYLLYILQSVLVGAGAFMAAPRAAVCAHRIVEVLEAGPVTATTTTTTTTALGLPAAPTRPTSIELHSIGFRHPRAEEPVLRDIDLVVPPGTTTALVGPTGAGKSTLLGLVARLLEPDTGRVVLGGVDLASISTAALASTIGYVPQRTRLFSGTIASNLRFAKPAAEDDELWDALEIAQAASFVHALPQGLATPVGQDGHTVSGGQRQRLTIARALVARPPVYLFDDAFSALDHRTETALRASLVRTTTQATVLLVAHRLETVRMADRIAVLDGGAVVACGTHDELVAVDGTYRDIARSQATHDPGRTP